MYKYLLEIKNRLFFLFVTGISTVLVCYFYKEILLFLVLQSNLFTIIKTNSRLFYFIFTDVTEIFAVYMQLIIFFTVQIVILYLLYHFLVFLSPALYNLEYYYLSFIIKVFLGVWVFSIVLSNYILIPLTWNFFFSFQFLTVPSVNLHFEAKLNEYFNFYILLYSLCVFYCQIFTFFFFSFNYIYSNTKLIKKFRKLYYYFFVLFSTLISPPDIFSQIIISILTIFVYELLLFVYIFKFSLRSINLVTN